MARTATKNPPPPPPQGPVHDTALQDALGERYLAYALSTITSRSLPDVRDGLKPVHRRLLFAMHQLRLDPQSGFKKCARVVGDVIGKYHPHGDQSVYDALVRLAQEFAARWPLVDGQGNFGNIDGDNAAAMRYTEARMTAVAEALLDGIEDDAVDFRPTYDGSEEEPVVLPARFPNLLANGSAGIAVGMATSIPPHNVDEICAALLHMADMLKRRPSEPPMAKTETLLKYIKGPDFPTGGVLVEPHASIKDAYDTGRGAFRLRARWQVEKLAQGQYQIVVTEIPYQVQKAKLVEKIADLLNAKKLPLLDDIRDESAEDVRLVLVPKSRTVEPGHVMEMLFRATDLEARIPLNMNVLADGRTPRVMNLREVLQSFLDHRHVVLQRRARHRLAAIEHRLEVLGGYLVAYLNLDKVIRIIREEDEPKPVLVKTFKLTDVQAEAILNMRLRALRKLEEMEIRGEHKALTEEKKGLAALLKDEGKRWAAIAEEVKDIRKKFGAATPLGQRRTEVADAPALVAVPLDALVEKEPITVIGSEKGWIRAVKGHVEPSDDVKYKEGDRGRFWRHAQSTDKLQLFATNGRFYTIPCEKLPRGRGFGEPLRLFIDLGNEDDVVALLVHDPARKLLVAARDGRGFVVPEGETVAQTRGGRRVLSLKDGGEAQVCKPVEGDSVALVGENRKLLVFDLADVPVMDKGRGVTLQRFKDGGLDDAKTFVRKDGLTWTSGARTFTIAGKDLAPYVGARGQAGRIVPKGFPRNNRFDA